MDRIAGIAVKASDRNPAMIVKAETITGRVMNLSASSIAERGVGSGEWGIGSGESGIGNRESESGK